MNGTPIRREIKSEPTEPETPDTSPFNEQAFHYFYIERIIRTLNTLKQVIVGLKQDNQQKGAMELQNLKECQSRIGPHITLLTLEKSRNLVVDYFFLYSWDKRTKEDLQTPNKYNMKYSRRAWDGLITKWRLHLHKYDES
nr:unnamed protein product [Callosobruchus analis]